VLGYGGSRRRKCPRSRAAQLLSMEGQWGKEAFYQMASPNRAKLPTTPVPRAAQDEGL